VADVIGMSDVSSPDTGKGSQLKTGGGRRKHNMPKACVEKLLKKNKNMSRSQAHKICYPGQEAGTSSKKEQDKVGWDIAKSKNVRMKRKLKKQSQSGPKGY
jgi:hypothetical protein